MENVVNEESLKGKGEHRGKKAIINRVTKEVAFC